MSPVVATLFRPRGDRIQCTTGATPSLNGTPSNTGNSLFSSLTLPRSSPLSPTRGPPTSVGVLSPPRSIFSVTNPVLPQYLLRHKLHPELPTLLKFHSRLVNSTSPSSVPFRSVPLLPDELIRRPTRPVSFLDPYPDPPSIITPTRDSHPILYTAIKPSVIPSMKSSFSIFSSRPFFL